MSHQDYKKYDKARDLFPFFSSSEGEGSIYFDHAAMGLWPEPVIEKVQQFQFSPFGKKRLDGLLSSISTSLKVNKEWIYPNMGAHMAFERMVQFLDRGKFCRFLIDPLSHKAITNPLDALVSRDRGSYQFLKLGEDHQIDPQSLLSGLSKDITAVVLNQVGNLHGHEQFLEHLYELICQFNQENGSSVLLIVDGSQAPARLKLKVPPCDIFFFAQQKCFSLPGAVTIISDTAAKVLASKEDIAEARHFLKEFYMAGTPHFLSILSFAQTLEFLIDLDEGMVFKSFHRLKILEELSSHCYQKIKELPGVCVLGDHDGYLKTNRGILSFVIKGYNQGEIARELAQFGIYLRCGALDQFQHYFCVPNAHKVYPLLEECNGALRVSLQYMNTVEELDRFFTMLKRIAPRHKG